MRKKLMIPALLLGVLFLGSCVKETESQSVTDIRDAKAEQLLARADLNNAAAQATKIAAEAEVALMEAKARAEAANTELYKAQTETIKKQQELTTLKLEAAKIENEAQKIENQKAQLEVEKALFDLDMAKKNAELALAQIAEDLKVWKAQNEAALAQAKVDVAEAKQAILDYEQQLVDNANQAELDAVSDRLFALSVASNNYEAALSDLNDAEADLLNAEANLVMLENDLVDLNTLKEESIIYNNNEIAEYKAYIDILKKYTNYTEDLDALKAKNKELMIQTEALRNDYVEKLNAEALAYAEVDTELAALHDTLLTDPFYLYLVDGTLLPADDEAGVYGYTVNDVEYAEMDYLGIQPWAGMPEFYYTAAWENAANYMLELVYDDYGYIDGRQLFSQTKTEKISIEEGENIYEFSVSDSLYIYTEGYKQLVDPRKYELRLAPVLEYSKGLVEGYAEFIELLQSTYNGEAAGYFTAEEDDYYGITNEYRYDISLYLGEADRYYTEYAKSEKKKLNAVDRTKAAKEEYDEDPTEENLAVYMNAYYTEQALVEALERAESEIAGYQTRVDACEALYKIYMNEAEYLAAFQEKLDAYNDAVIASDANKVAATTARVKALWALNAVEDEIQAIALIVNGDGYVQGAQAIDETIANCELMIEYLEEQNANIAVIEQKEEAIELQKLTVEKCKVILDAVQARVDALKAELDALLKK